MTELSRTARTVEKRYISRAYRRGKEVANLSQVDINFNRHICATNAHMSVTSCNYSCNCSCNCKEMVESSRAVNSLRNGRITKNSLSIEGS